MDEKTQKFINNIGALVETWMLVHATFISKGLAQDEAIIHTKALMQCFFGKNNEQSTDN